MNNMEQKPYTPTAAEMAEAKAAIMAELRGGNPTKPVFNRSTLRKMRSYHPDRDAVRIECANGWSAHSERDLTTGLIYIDVFSPTGEMNPAPYDKLEGIPEEEAARALMEIESL